MNGLNGPGWSLHGPNETLEVCVFCAPCRISKHLKLYDEIESFLGTEFRKFETFSSNLLLKAQSFCEAV